jgi:hypothetical protein
VIIIAAFYYLIKVNKASSGQSTPNLHQVSRDENSKKRKIEEIPSLQRVPPKISSLQRVPKKRCEIGLKKEATEPEPEFERLYFFRNRCMGRKKDIFDKEDIKRVEAFEREEQEQEILYKFGFPREKHPKEGKRGWRPEITYDLVKVERETHPHMFDVFSDDEE